MGYTDNCDIFASFHEDGFNKIIDHVRKQRPSLFNYATAAVANNSKLLCKEIKAHPIVSLRNNPVVTIVDPLPIPGTNYGVNFAVQLADLKIDFHPSTEFDLPPELKPLGQQKLAIRLSICGGIGCPQEEIIDKLIPPPQEPSKEIQSVTHATDYQVETVPIIPLPTRELTCFCLDAFATGGVRTVSYNGKAYLEPFVDGFEIVDIQPEGLENSLECYIGLLLKLAVMPQLRILLQHAPLNLTQGATDLFPTPTNVVLSPMPTSADLPHNPAIEKDQLKAFIKAEVM